MFQYPRVFSTLILGGHLILTFPELFFKNNHPCMCFSYQRGNTINCRQNYSFSVQQSCSVVPLSIRERTLYAVFPCGTSFSHKKGLGKLPVKLVLVMFVPICGIWDAMTTDKMILTYHSDLNTRKFGSILSSWHYVIWGLRLGFGRKINGSRCLYSITAPVLTAPYASSSENHLMCKTSLSPFNNKRNQRP